MDLSRLTHQTIHTLAAIGNPTTTKAAVPPSQLTPYQYDALFTPTSIRLLSILPKRLNTDVTICGQPLITCLLNTVDLNQVPDYSALSCTGGNPRTVADSQYHATQKWPISVNGRLLYISKNLHQALQHSRDQRDEKIDERRQPFHKTPLIEAAEKGSAEEVQDLLYRGASVESQDRFGETALHYAAENGHPEVVKLLLRYHASRLTLDSAKRTPLDCCVQKKRNQWVYVQSLLTGSSFLDGTDNSDDHIELPQIWIDTICIDQGNITERNFQTAMMPRIYQQASEVVAWLGVMDRDTAREAAAVTRLSECDLRALKIGERELIKAFLTRHTWFQRNLLAQELAQAQKIEMQCGRYAFDWDSLTRFVILSLNYHAPAHQTMSPPQRPPKYNKTKSPPPIPPKYGHVRRPEPGSRVLSHLWSTVKPEVQSTIRLELSNPIQIKSDEQEDWDTFLNEMSSFATQVENKSAIADDYDMDF